MLTKFVKTISLFSACTFIAIAVFTTSNDVISLSQGTRSVIYPPSAGVHVFFQNVQRLNEDLEKARKEIRFDRNWRYVSSGGNSTSRKYSFIGGNVPNFLEMLAKTRQVKTVIMPWVSPNGRFAPDKWNSMTDDHNLLVQTYFPWTANKRLCRLLKQEAAFPVCHVNISKALESTALSPSFVPFLNVKVKQNVSRRNEKASQNSDLSIWTSTYVHIIRNVVVTSSGDFVLGNLKFLPYGCLFRKKINRYIPQPTDQLPVYDEVFVIMQLWGGSVYHELIEVVSRLAPYLDFLHRHPSIKIQVSQRAWRAPELFDVLKLNTSRMIYGDFRARIAYVPQANPCGSPNVQTIQLYSTLLRVRLKEHFHTLGPRDRLVLIRRSKVRRFVDQNNIEKAMQRTAADYNLRYTLFADNPVPSLLETMRIFNEAVMVVAPHGAGLANILFSEPETYVVETICFPRFLYECFMNLAHVLGHRWHGLQAWSGCPKLIDISAYEIETSVREHLQLWTSESSRTRRFKTV